MGLRLLILPALLVGIVPAAARDCVTIDADARDAETSRDLPRLEALAAEAASPASGCSAEWLAAFRDDIAKTYVDRFFMATETLGGGPKAMAENIGLLEAGRRYGEPWQLLLTLAEVRYELDDYDAAAPLYAEAVAAMSTMARTLPADAPEMRSLPDAEGFQAIHARMAESALLAKDFVAPPASRGTPEAGLFVESFRGYVVKSVPVPVQFEFGTADFTEKGRKAAEHLAAYLKSSKLPAVTLVGHTDPIGSEEDNLVLSEQRAETLRDFVVAAGYGGTVRVVGRGESEPYRSPEAVRFAGNDDALFALDRRVELQR